MPLVKCPGCKTKYQTGSSLSAHQRKCPGLKTKAKELFKKREKNRKDESSTKIALQEHFQDDDLLQTRSDLRDHLNPFDTEEIHNGKRKLVEQNSVSIYITSQ